MNRDDETIKKFLDENNKDVPDRTEEFERRYNELEAEFEQTKKRQEQTMTELRSGTVVVECTKAIKNTENGLHTDETTFQLTNDREFTLLEQYVGARNNIFEFAEGKKYRINIQVYEE